MAQIEPSVLVNLTNIRKVWGEQSKQFKEALRASGHEEGAVLKALQTVAEPAGPAEGAGSHDAKTVLSGLQHKFYNLVIRTKPS